MTKDSKGVSIHPDQHVITGSPLNSDVIFIGDDGGVFRVDGTFVDASADCNSRGLAGADLTDCLAWLSKIPKTVTALNDGLSTLQYQSLSVNPQNPTKDIMGGTQDNGTHVTKNAKKWSVSVFGDGGQSGVHPTNANIRMHTYYDAQPDVNFRGRARPAGTGPATRSSHRRSTPSPGRSTCPLIADPVIGGTWFAGISFVWRTQDNGGPQAQLDPHCNELTGDFYGPVRRLGADRAGPPARHDEAAR